MLEPYDPDRERGLYRKFDVFRVDRSIRHADCEYFVLDLRHDPLALQALETYAYAAHRHGYGPLADDLLEKVKVFSALQLADVTTT